MTQYTFDAVRWCDSMKIAHFRNKDFTTAENFKQTRMEIDSLRARLAEVEKEHAGLQEAVRWKDEVLQDSALWSIQTQTAFLEWNATVREARAAVDALVGEV